MTANTYLVTILYFSNLTAVLGMLDQCPTPQLTALANKAKFYYGPVYNWTGSQIQAARIIIGKY